MFCERCAMKKHCFYIIIAIISVISLGIFVSCNNNDKIIPDATEPTTESVVDDFQQLKTIFPRTLLIPEECGDEKIYVNFSEKNNGNYLRSLVMKNEKIQSLVNGGWYKKYTDYTINVQFNYLENFILPDEIINKINTIEINSYKAYQEKTNTLIIVFDELNKMFYFISIDEVSELTIEERDMAIQQYFDLMCRVEK